MKEFINYVNKFDDRQKFLDHCVNDLALKVKEDGPLILLDYNQIDSPRKHEFVDLCRGTIFNWDEKKIVCRPFKRFYNYGEYPEMETAFDWETAVVDEKVDGSLIKVWFNTISGNWEVGTRGSMYGDNTISTLTGEEGTITFKDLFKRTLGVDEQQLQDGLKGRCNTEFTYLFELCTLENKVVTAYEKDTVFFLSAIMNNGEYELYPEFRNMCVSNINLGLNGSIKLPTVYELNSFDAAVKASNELGGLKEGFVIRDAFNNRLKIKSMAYVAAHHLRGEGVTPKRAVLLALAGEVPEFISYFPEYTEILTEYVDRVNNTLMQINEVYSKIKDLETQKEFALEAVKHKFSGVLFSLRKGEQLKSIIDKMTDANKVAIFG